MEKEDQEYLYNLFQSIKCETQPIKLHKTNPVSISKPKYPQNGTDSSFSCEISDEDFTKLLLKEFDEQNGNQLQTGPNNTCNRETRSHMENEANCSSLMEPPSLLDKTNGGIPFPETPPSLLVKKETLPEICNPLGPPVDIFRGDPCSFAASTPKRSGVVVKKRPSLAPVSHKRPVAQGSKLSHNKRHTFIYPDPKKEAQRTPGSSCIEAYQSSFMKPQSSPIKKCDSVDQRMSAVEQFDTESEQIMAQIDIDLPVVHSGSENILKENNSTTNSDFNGSASPKQALSGFKMANGHAVEIDPSNLAEAKLLFVDDQSTLTPKNVSPELKPQQNFMKLSDLERNVFRLEKIPSNSEKTVKEFRGFETANGNLIKTDPRHLMKAALLFADDSNHTICSAKTVSNQKSPGVLACPNGTPPMISTISNHKSPNGQIDSNIRKTSVSPKSMSEFHGFKKANGTLVKTNPKDLRRAQMLLAESDDVTTDMNYKQPNSENIRESSPIAKFTMATKAQQCLSGEEECVKSSANFMGTTPHSSLKTALPIKAFEGFRLANGTSVKTNEENLVKAKLLLADDKLETTRKIPVDSFEQTDSRINSYKLPESNNNHHALAKSPEQKIGGNPVLPISPVIKCSQKAKIPSPSAPFGFQTAGGRCVQVKPECLSRAIKLLEGTDDDAHCVPNVKKTPTAIDTQEMASITEAFALENSWNEPSLSPAIKRGRPPSDSIIVDNKKRRISSTDFQQPLSDFKVKNQPCLIKLSALHLKTPSSISMSYNLVSFESIQRDFYDLEGIQKSVLPKGWLSNHFKWISLKLLSYDRLLSHHLSGVAMTKSEVLRQLRYRYDIEIRDGRRSALRKICEQDDSPQKTLVLFIVSMSRGVDGWSLILSDGWYSINAQTDGAFNRLLNNKLVVGSKILIHGAELAGSPAPCHPLEASSNVCLNISSNMMRRAKWCTKLGYQLPVPLKATPIDAILSDGGTIASMDICVSRKYPLVYLDKRAKSNVMLSEKEHQKRRQAAENDRATITQKLYADAEKEVGEIPLRKFEFPSRIDSGFLQSLDDGEHIFAFMMKYADDGSTLLGLTEDQINLGRTWRENQASKRASRIQKLVDKRLCQETTYNPIPMLNIGVEDRSGDTAMVTVWRPHPRFVDQIQEGKCFTVRYLTANGCRNGFKQIVSNKNTIWRNTPSKAFHCRHKRQLWPLDCIDNAQPWREIDAVGLVVNVHEASKTRQKAFLVSHSDTLVTISMETSEKHCCLQDQLKLHEFIYVKNAQIIRRGDQLLEAQISPRSQIQTRFTEETVLQAVETIKSQITIESLITHGKRLLEVLETSATKEPSLSPVLCGDQRSTPAREKIQVLQKRYGTPSPLLISPSMPSPSASRPYRRPFRHK